MTLVFLVIYNKSHSAKGLVPMVFIQGGYQIIPTFSNYMLCVLLCSIKG